MKNPLITLTLLSSALNISPISAQEVIHQFSTENNSQASIERALFNHSLVLSEIQDEELKREILTTLANLISLSQTVKSDDKTDESEELEGAVIGLRNKVFVLHSSEPSISSQVKSKLLGEMLRSGVVVIDEEETLSQSRVQVVLNSSIVTQLENRPGFIDSVAASNGTVCI